MPKSEEDDAAAFAEAVRGARTLGGTRRVAPALVSELAPVRPRRSAAAGSRQEKAAGLRVEGAGESWTGRADGVDRKVVRKLRSGGVPIEGQVDLHGQTRAQAVRALDTFLAAARASGHRCVVVIHGRGLHSGENGPALRDAVRAALTTGNQASALLACCTAPPARGGAGATLVLLRR